MKTQIFISGQLNGNHLLRSLLDGAEEERSGMFNSFTLTFRTKREAERSLWEAYKTLRAEEETKNVTRYCPKSALYYDASSAKIYQP